jgi:hypothetical protein
VREKLQGTLQREAKTIKGPGFPGRQNSLNEGYGLKSLRENWIFPNSVPQRRLSVRAVQIRFSDRLIWTKGTASAVPFELH